MYYEGSALFVVVPGGGGRDVQGLQFRRRIAPLSCSCVVRVGGPGFPRVGGLLGLTSYSRLLFLVPYFAFCAGCCCVFVQDQCGKPGAGMLRSA